MPNYDGLFALWKAVFGDEGGFWDTFRKTGFAPENCLTIEEGDSVSAGLCWLDCEFAGKKIAYIYAVATREDRRGKGLCRRLMAQARQTLTRRGYAAAMLMPESAPLRQMYAAMGYETWTAKGVFSCLPAETAIPLRSVSGEEYAALRRQYLPQGSVLQEGKNIPFLESQAELFAGDDFCLAAWRKGKELYGFELLGNPAQASAIVKALDCAEGVFCTPGEHLPYAMGLRLQPDLEAPSYFGFAYE